MKEVTKPRMKIPNLLDDSTQSLRYRKENVGEGSSSAGSE